jgi:hypothetical protein
LEASGCKVRKRKKHDKHQRKNNDDRFKGDGTASIRYE